MAHHEINPDKTGPENIREMKHGALLVQNALRSIIAQALREPHGQLAQDLRVLGVILAGEDPVAQITGGSDGP